MRRNPLFYCSSEAGGRPVHPAGSLLFIAITVVGGAPFRFNGKINKITVERIRRLAGAGSPKWEPVLFPQGLRRQLNSTLLQQGRDFFDRPLQKRPLCGRLS